MHIQKVLQPCQSFGWSTVIAICSTSLSVNLTIGNAQNWLHDATVLPILIRFAHSVPRFGFFLALVRWGIAAWLDLLAHA